MVRRVAMAGVGLVVIAGCGGDTLSGAHRASEREANSLGLTTVLPAEYRRVCAKQARYAPAGAGVCPPLIPRGALKVMDSGPLSMQRRYRAGWLTDLSSHSINHLRGEPIVTNGGHWHYDVSWTDAASRLLVHRGVQRPPGASTPSSCRLLALAGERVQACRVVSYEHGGGLNGGHIAYVWRDGRVRYVLSLHGYANEPRVRAMTTALIAAVSR